jgi:hypothetical protein
MIKQVIAWVTEDGRQFFDRDEAVKHDGISALKTFIAAEDPGLDFMEIDTLASFIYYKWEKLAKLMNAEIQYENLPGMEEIRRDLDKANESIRTREGGGPAYTSTYSPPMGEGTFARDAIASGVAVEAEGQGEGDGSAVRPERITDLLSGSPSRVALPEEDPSLSPGTAPYSPPPGAIDEAGRGSAGMEGEPKRTGKVDD